MSYCENIAAIPFFEKLPSKAQSSLATIAEKFSYKKDQLIFSEDQSGQGVFFVIHGKVKVLKRSPEGNEHVLGEFGPGQPVGEAALFDDINYPAKALAATDSIVLFFPKKAFLNHIQEYPQLALNMLAVFSQRLSRFQQFAGHS